MATEPELRAYQLSLETAVAKHLSKPWSSCWPRWSSADLRIHHSHRYALVSTAQAIQYAIADRESSSHSTCMIENISSQWAVELGAAWNIPTEFFIDYLQAMDAQTSKHTFKSESVPGAAGGVRSKRGSSWATLRGVLDYGLLGHDTVFEDYNGHTIRTQGKTGSGRHIQDTVISIFQVHEKLDLVLVDKASDGQYQFPLNQDPEFPYQAVLRMAFVEWPGHVCFPRLRDVLDSAVLPLWQLMNDKYTTEALTYCLHDHGVDDFMYKACVVDTERHVNVALNRVRFIGLQDTFNGEEKMMGELRDVRQALNRLNRCIEENKGFERACNRRRHAAATDGHHCERKYFHHLADQIRDLEQAVLRDMKVLMMTMNTRDVANNLRLTEASHRQTRNMAVLTWLMMVYAPLSFAAGIFGMNLQQLNESGLPVTFFVMVAVALLIGTVVIAVGSAYVSGVAHSRRCTVRQLLWPQQASQVATGWWTSSLRLAKIATRPGRTFSDPAAWSSSKSVESDAGKIV